MGGEEDLTTADNLMAMTVPLFMVHGDRCPGYRLLLNCVTVV